MSGVEAITLIQLIDACIGITETIIKIAHAVRDAQGLPPNLRSLLEKLSAIEELLKTARENCEKGSVTDEKSKISQPILRQCEQALKELHDLFTRACPKDGDNATKRLWKGTKTVFFGRDSQLQKLLVIIQDNLKILEHNEIYIIGDKLDGLQALTQSLSEDMEGGSYQHFGTGHIVASSGTTYVGGSGNSKQINTQTYNEYPTNYIRNSSSLNLHQTFFGLTKVRNLFNQASDIVDTSSVSNTLRSAIHGPDSLSSTLRSMYQDLSVSSVPSACPGTCSWLYDHPVYKQWIACETSNTLWLCGTPGCGKTIVSQCTLQGWRESVNPSHNVAHFFFSRYTANTTLPINFLSAMVYQILQQYPIINDFLNEIPGLNELQSMTDAASSEECLWRTLHQILQALHSASIASSQKPLLCIIDALDECFDNLQNQFLRCLDRYLFSSRFPIKLYVTCRPDYLERLRYITNPQNIIHLDEENADDIEKYVADCLRLWSDKAADPETLDRLQPIIVGKAEGSFLWAALVMEGLFQRGYTLQTVSSVINAFPSGRDYRLRSIYEEILDQALNCPYDKDLVLDIKSILRAVVLAARPLTIQELAHYLETENQHEQRLNLANDIRRNCFGLLKIEKNTVKLFHNTLIQYLGDVAVCSPQFYINFSVGQCQLAQTCLRHAASSVALIRSDKAEDIASAILEDPFLKYAASQWPYHVRRSTSQHQAIAQLIRTLLGPVQNFRKWFALILSFDSLLRQELRLASIHIGEGTDLSDLQPQQAHVLSLLGFEQSLFEALFRGNEFDALSSQALSPDNRDGNGRTPAHWAATWSGYHAGSERFLTQLISKVIAGDVRFDSFQGNPDSLVHILNRFPESVHCQDNFGCIPLHMACTLASSTKAKILLDANSDVNCQNHAKRSPLHECCYPFSADVAELLISHDADVNICDEDENTPLHIAARYGLRHIVKLLIERRADVDAQNGLGATPLQLAMIFFEGNGESLWNRLDSDRPSKQPKEGPIDEMNLYFASAVNRELVIEKLLSAGADTERRFKEGFTPLMTAILSKHLPFVELLISARANVDAIYDDFTTPLHLALMVDCEAIWQALIAANANTSCSNPEGIPLLHLAAYLGRTNIVRYLIEIGNDVNFAQSTGNTPLNAAASTDMELSTICLSVCYPEFDVRGFLPILENRQINVRLEAHEKVVTDLLHAGANVNSVDMQGASPLHVAAIHGHIPIVESLIEAGADVNSGDRKARRPVDAAAAVGHEACVQFLLQRGALVQSATVVPYGASLHWAAEMGHVSILRLLIAAGCNVNELSSEGLAPIHTLARHGRSSYVTYLSTEGNGQGQPEIDEESAMDYIAQRGRTWDAVEQDQLECLRLLISNGADVNIAAENGFSALSISAELGRTSIVRALLDAGARVDTTSSSVLNRLWHRAARFTMALPGGATGLDDHVHTALINASQEGHLDVVELLLPHTVDVDYMGIYGTALHRAARMGHQRIVAVLLARGANILLKANDMWDALSLAAYAGHGGTVECLLRNNANVSSVGPNGWTALHVAACRGHAKVVEALFAALADPNTVTTNGEGTALHLAVKYDHIEVVRLFLEKGPDLNITNENGHTPLHVAAGGNHAEIFGLLVDKGASVHTRDVHGNTPLISATRQGHTNMVRQLIEHEADAIETDSDKNSTLHFVAQSGIAAMTGLLLELAPNVDAFNSEGYSALHIAVGQGHLEITRLLLEARANPNIQGCDDMAAVHFAAQIGRTDMLQLIVSHNGLLTLRATHGWTTLHFSAAFGHAETCDWLLANGVNIDSVDANGMAPIMNALARSQYDVVQRLLDANADISIKTSHGYTIQHCAAAGTRIEFLKILEAKGVSLEVSSFLGYNVLHAAAGSKSCDILSFLLHERHQDPNVSGLLGITPLHVAIFGGNLPAVKILIETGAFLDRPDGFGRTCLEWVHRSSNPKLRDTVLKTAATQMHSVTAATFWSGFQSLRNLVSNGGMNHTTLLAALREVLDRVELDDELYDLLGHCFRLISDEHNARMAYCQRMSVNRFNGKWIHRASCHMCQSGRPMEGKRYVCLQCPEIDLCEQCMSAYMHEWCMIDCRHHRFLEVPGPDWKVEDMTGGHGSDSADRPAWLKQIRAKLLRDS